MMVGNTMKETIRIIALILCLTAALFALSSCGEQGVRASGQSVSPLIGTWIAQDKSQSGMTFNADGAGYMKRDDSIEKITFADKGNGTLEMSAEHSKTPITQGYRIDGDTLYMRNEEIGIEDAFTRKQ